MITAEHQHRTVVRDLRERGHVAMQARRRSGCPACDRVIDTGDCIARSQNGAVWVCASCYLRHYKLNVIADPFPAVSCRGRSTAGKMDPTSTVFATPRTQEPVALDMAPVVALLRKGGERLQFPKVTFTTPDGDTIQLAFAGPKSRYAGSVTVTDGRKFPNSIWYGHITPDGNFHPARSCGDWVAPVLTQLAADPVGYARAYGKRTGNCCFCRRDLTTPESVTAGYGPTCADNFGLPWGD
jgi:hypothetical protein